jgi:hypothetical protein
LVGLVLGKQFIGNSLAAVAPMSIYRRTKQEGRTDIYPTLALTATTLGTNERFVIRLPTFQILPSRPVYCGELSARNLGFSFVGLPRSRSRAPFFRLNSISSSVIPFVSGTNSATNAIASKQNPAKT